MLKTLEQDLMSSFKKGEKSTRWPGFFQVSDYANQRLTEEVGITSDYNEAKLGGGTGFAFTVRFDWNCQRWMVGTC